jgi:hypothetical protein
MKKLNCGWRSAPCGSPPEFGQALGDALPIRPPVIIPNQGETENLSMLRFRRAPMLGCPYAQAANDIFIQIANRERRHSEPHALSNAAMTS